MTMRRALLPLLFLVAGSALADVVIKGPKGEVKLTAADIASMPLVKVTIADHGKDATFEGVELQAVLEKVGAPAGDHLRGKELAKYLVVDARDGYRAVFSLAEVSPVFTDRKVILAIRRDDKPLGEEEGPVRIVIEGEKRNGRCVRQVKSIRIVAAD